MSLIRKILLYNNNLWKPTKKDDIDLITFYLFNIKNLNKINKSHKYKYYGFLLKNNNDISIFHINPSMHFDCNIEILYQLQKIYPNLKRHEIDNFLGELLRIFYKINTFNEFTYIEL